MKLPEKIKGYNKIRDAKICLWYEEWHDSELPKIENTTQIVRRIAEKVGLKERRVWLILRDNHAYIPINREYEKRKRIHYYKRQIAKRGDKTEKDSADLVEALRKEIEGDRAQIDQSKHTHITIVNPEGYRPKHERAQAERISSRLPA